MITKTKNELLVLKVFKILAILAQIFIIILILQSFKLNGKIDKCNADIEKIKATIQEKRTTNYMSNIEKEWTGYHYKLLAVREMLSHRTEYGLMLKKFAEVVPADIQISELSFKNNVLNFSLQIPKNKKKEYADNIYKYVDELKLIFDQNAYFNKDTIEFVDTKEVKINDTLCGLIEVKIDYDATNKSGK